MAKVALNLRIDKQVKEELQVLASSSKRKLSDYCRLELQAAVKRGKKKVTAIILVMAITATAASAQFKASNGEQFRNGDIVTLQTGSLPGGYFDAVFNQSNGYTISSGTAAGIWHIVKLSNVDGHGLFLALLKQEGKPDVLLEIEKAIFDKEIK